jgi:hypothetical protein
MSAHGGAGPPGPEMRDPDRQPGQRGMSIYGPTVDNLPEREPRVKPDIRRQCLMDLLDDPNEDAREIAADSLFKEYYPR